MEDKTTVGEISEIKIRRESVAVKILKGVALAGMVLVAASSPYFVSNYLRARKRASDKKEWRKFYHSLNYLKRRGYVRFGKQTPDGTMVEITRLGEKVVKKIDIGKLSLPKSGVWDEKWRIVVFDVPNYKSKNRSAFRERIKELGFIMVQKSVWVYPFECYEAVMVLRKYYGIERHVTYLEAGDIEDEHDWRSWFNFKSTRANR